jgi:hypothetical protein
LTSQPTTTVCPDRDSARNLFTKRVDGQKALAKVPDLAMEANRALGLHVLDMVSVMA